MKKCIFLSLFFLLFTICSSYALPNSFTKTPEINWISIELRDDVNFEHAWNLAFQILSRQFDIEYSSKEDGYIRTGWLYSWSGTWQKDYRVRVTLKFSEDHKVIEIKPEAQAMVRQDDWVMGVDSRLVSTIKTDLMGTLGRTTR